MMILDLLYLLDTNKYRWIYSTRSSGISTIGHFKNKKKRFKVVSIHLEPQQHPHCRWTTPAWPTTMGLGNAPEHPYSDTDILTLPLDLTTMYAYSRLSPIIQCTIWSIYSFCGIHLASCILDPWRDLPGLQQVELKPPPRRPPNSGPPAAPRARLCFLITRQARRLAFIIFCS